MKKMIIGAVALSFLASTASAEVWTKRKLRNMKTGEIVFDCGTVDIQRRAGFVTPGAVMVTRNGPVAIGKVSAKTQAYIRACYAGTETLYVGHSDPMLQLGVGVTKHVGGGDSNISVYGSQAFSGSSSGASAGASAGVKIK